MNATTFDVTGRTFSAFLFTTDRAGVTTATNMSFVGTATGPRVEIRSNGVIDFNNTQLSAIAGTSDGGIASGGRYLPGFAGEVGSNANGSFVRFADGTQVCWNGGAPITTNPAAFVGTVTSIDGDRLRIGRWRLL